VESSVDLRLNPHFYKAKGAAPVADNPRAQAVAGVKRDDLIEERFLTSRTPFGMAGVFFCEVCRETVRLPSRASGRLAPQPKMPA
jgi:hypothetical protein